MRMVKPFTTVEPTVVYPNHLSVFKDPQEQAIRGRNRLAKKKGAKPCGFAPFLLCRIRLMP